MRVYEKVKPGIWVYNGLFLLVDAWQADAEGRRVCKFKLRATNNRLDESSTTPEQEAAHTRVIPTDVKRQVWARDQGRCQECGADDNLHFDHIIPYSRGGSSLTAENVQLLCARHNLEKRDLIL